MANIVEITQFKSAYDFIQEQWMGLSLWSHEIGLYSPAPYHYPNLVKHMPIDYLKLLLELKPKSLNLKIYPGEDFTMGMLFELPFRYYTYSGKNFDTATVEKFYPNQERQYFGSLRCSITLMKKQNLLQNYQRIIHLTPTPFDTKVLREFAASGHDYYSQINSEWAFFWLPNGDIAIYF